VYEKHYIDHTVGGEWDMKDVIGGTEEKVLSNRKRESG
jgi:hypothetical protein